MNERLPVQTLHGSTGELSRLGTIARIAAEKGWGHYAERLGFGSHGEPEESTSPKTDIGWMRPPHGARRGR